MTKSNQLINHLRKYRLEQQLTQEQLAEKLGVAFLTLNRWLRGHAQPSQLHHYRIEKLLSLKRTRRTANG